MARLSMSVAVGALVLLCADIRRLFDMPMRRSNDLSRLFSAATNALNSGSHTYRRSSTVEQTTDGACKVHVDETPRYHVERTDDGSLLHVQLPHVTKEDIVLSVDQGRLIVHAPFRVPAPAVEHADTEEQKALSSAESENADTNAPSSSEDSAAVSRIVIVEEDEDAHFTTVEVTKPAATETSVPVQTTRSPPSVRVCDVEGNYDLALQLPKNTLMDQVSASFEEGELRVHLPQRSAQAPTRKMIQVQ